MGMGWMSKRRMKIPDMGSIRVDTTVVTRTRNAFSDGHIIIRKIFQKEKCSPG